MIEGLFDFEGFFVGYFGVGGLLFFFFKVFYYVVLNELMLMVNEVEEYLLCVDDLLGEV